MNTNFIMNEKLSNKGDVRYINLKFCMIEALYCNENRHPQVVMKELGITYQYAMPQSMGDQWWFLNCENLPKKMPSYLSIKEN